MSYAYLWPIAFPFIKMALLLHSDASVTMAVTMRCRSPASPPLALAIDISLSVSFCRRRYSFSAACALLTAASAPSIRPAPRTCSTTDLSTLAVPTARASPACISGRPVCCCCCWLLYEARLDAEVCDSG